MANLLSGGPGEAPVLDAATVVLVRDAPGETPEAFQLAGFTHPLLMLSQSGAVRGWKQVPTGMGGMMSQRAGGGKAGAGR